MDCLFFINPVSGSGYGRRLAEQIEHLNLPAPAFKQVVFIDPDRLSQQVYSCARGKDLIIICGGDGTVSTIVSHLVDLDQVPPFAIIPLGTGNDIARSTGWLRSWTEFGLDGLFYAIKEGRCNSFDVWQIRTKNQNTLECYTFCAYAGIGYDGRMCQEFSRLNQFFTRWCIPTGIKRLLYLPAGLRVLYKNLLHPEKIRCNISYDDGGTRKSLQDRFGQILLCNSGFYAGGRLIFKNYSLEDGLIEFFGLKGYLSYMQLLFEARLPVRHSSIPPIQSSFFKMELFGSAYFQIDGEPVGILGKNCYLELGLLRSIPLLAPFLDKLAKRRLKDAEAAHSLEELSSPARPVVT